jgi:bifunctional UDP-N-acetylglucosamine pyrophosphorylase/glucosamine-1-phosphate N-acetyltransferase
MSNKKIAVVILAAGKGTRMKSSKHKVLHPIGGRTILDHLMEKVDALNPAKKIVVVGAVKEQVEEAVGSDVDIVVQIPQLGTGHAVDVCKNRLEDFKGDVLIVVGDVPLLRLETMQAMIEMRRSKSNPAVVVLGFRPEDTKTYGRLVVKDGELEAITEHKDASAEVRAINLCNSGIIAVDGNHLFDFLSKLDNQNASEEYYLTDIIKIARDAGHSCKVVETNEWEVMGINARTELAQAEAVFQKNMRQHFLEQGVTMIDPATVYFSYDTKIANDVVIAPNVFFGPGVTVETGVNIYSFCHFEGAVIREGASVGPYARLRPAADVGKGCKVGNFVEIKKSKIEDGAKISHLSYIGDAVVGAGANIGAGTITCNYDGYNKSQTIIGKGAFVGSNTSLVAPVTIGDGAIVGAGSVVTKDVETDALAVTRASQKQLSGWAANFRNKQGK